MADFLWYQLPTKWLCNLDEKLFLAAALGRTDRRGLAATADRTALTGDQAAGLLGHLRRRLCLLG